MSYEIDKTVSTFYFLVILILIFVSLNYQPSSSNLIKVLEILGNSSNTSSPNTANNSSSSISKILMKGKTIMIGSVGYITIQSVLRVGKRNRLIVTYFFTQEDYTKSSCKTVRRYQGT